MEKIPWIKIAVSYIDIVETLTTGISDSTRGGDGCISKNLTLNKNAHQIKPTIGKWSSLLILQQQLSHDQNKVKNESILK